MHKPEITNKTNARARAHLGAQGRLRCKRCNSARVSVHDQGSLGVLIMCEEPGCLSAHSVFQ